MRISDWSADVCSSDLDRPQEPHSRTDADEGCGHHRVRGRRKPGRVHLPPDRAPVANAAAPPGAAFRRRRSGKCAALFAGNFPAGSSLADWKSVVSGRSVSGRVKHGGVLIMKKKQKRKSKE